MRKFDAHPPFSPLSPQTPHDLHKSQNGHGYKGQNGKRVLFNRAPRPLKYRPYDLTVAQPGEELSEHFIAHSGTITHVRPGDFPETLSLTEWQRELTLFNALTRLKFFKRFLVGKAFRQWHNNVRFKLFCALRRKVAQNLFVSKATFTGPTMELHKICYDLSVTPMLSVPSAKTQVFLHPATCPTLTECK